MIPPSGPAVGCSPDGVVGFEDESGEIVVGEEGCAG